MDFVGIFSTGLIFSIFLLGMIISFRFLGFADLTIEGSFTMGAVIFAACLSRGWNPFVAALCSIAGGGLAGFFTAFLHSYIGINKLLSGITTLTMLYTVNLRILGKSNFYIGDYTTLLNYIKSAWFELIVVLLCSVALLLILKVFFSTNAGLYLRATGENSVFVKNLKVKYRKFILAGLVLSNSLIAFSGCLFCQYVGYSDIGIGQGMLVSMLTAMIIGENIIKPTDVTRQLLSAFAGAIIFQLLYSLALEAGVNPIDLKIIIGLLLILFFVVTKYCNAGKQSKNIGVDFL